MLTKIGLARKCPTKKPCSPVTATANNNVSKNAGRIPNDNVARNIRAEAETVAPSASDMMLPVSVMNVMPTATQPTNEMAVNSALRLRGVRKPGVVSANPAIAAAAARRIHSATCRTRARCCSNRVRSAISVMPLRRDG